MLAAMGTIIFMWQDGWLERFRNRRGVQAGLDGRVDVRQFQERSIVAVSVHFVRVERNKGVGRELVCSLARPNVVDRVGSVHATLGAGAVRSF